MQKNRETVLSKLSFLLKYYCFWWAFFVFSKILFLTYHTTKTLELSLATILQTFVVGSKLDWSFAGYVSLLPFLVYSFSVFPKIQNKLYVFIQSYTIIVLVLCSLLVVIDMELYRTWGFRIDATPLMYLSNPQEMMASAGASPVFLLVGILAILSGLGIFIYLKYLSLHIQKVNTPFYFLPIGLFFTAVLIIPIRGGLQLAPINQSAVYFSNQVFANHAAINPLWNFADSWVNKTAIKQNPYNYIENERAENLVDSLFSNPNAHTELVIDTNVAKPNVLIITWESLTAKVFSKTGGLPNILPELEHIADEGLLFTRCYASGDRSDKGLVAILSGYPAQTTASIMTMPKKTAKLPILSQDFKKQGYYTAWYYGGEPEFANIKSYMLEGQFDQLITKESFGAKDMNSKWGAHDHVVFKRILKDLQHQTQPFFINYFTLSSHEPFEVPMKTAFEGEGEKSLFLNAHHYTDKSLGEFIKKAKEQSWWKNTLVIIVADHGHRLPESTDKAENFHIPMVWTGGLLKSKGKVINTVCSQNDLIATLLAQLKLNHTAYRWSKNILSTPYKPFAYFAFNNGFGFVQQNNNYTFDNEGKQLIQSTGKVNSQDLVTGKAYLQQSFQDFLDK